jgi:hypothetical protein
MADRLDRIGLSNCTQRQRADEPIRLDSDDSLQHLYSPRRTRIHSKVEKGEVEARRKIIGAHGVPVEAAVDGGGLLPRQLTNVLGGGGAPSRSGQRSAGNAEIRCSSRIPRVLNEAALVLQNKGNGKVER